MSTKDQQAPEASARPIGLTELAEGDLAASAHSWVDKRLDLIRDVKVGVEVRLGTAEVSVAQLFALRDGETLKLETKVDDLVDVLLEGKVIARGEIVVVDEQFGIRLREIISPDRIG